MVRYAVGYRSRAFVTFGAPIAVDGFDAESRDVGARPRPSRAWSASAGRYKVLPTALVAVGPAAVDVGSGRAGGPRSATCSTRCIATGANLDVTTAPAVVAAAAEPLEARGIIARGQWTRSACASAALLRYYGAYASTHLLRRRRWPPHRG